MTYPKGPDVPAWRELATGEGAHIWRCEPDVEPRRFALGISMMLSSRYGGHGGLFGKRSVVAEQGPEDVDAAAGEGDDGLGVGAAVRALLEVVVAVGSGPHHGGLGG